jgi:hypothetical protein
MLMAIYYTDQQKKQIGEWLLELREIVTPGDFNIASPSEFSPKRDRARELVALLDQCRVHPASLIAYEFDRVRWIWQRLEAKCGGENRKRLSTRVSLQTEERDS